MLFASVINIVLSILLGKKIGLFGILVATAISRIVTNIWYEPKVLFKEYFKESVILYYGKKVLEIIGLIIIYIITYIVCKNINIFNNVILTLMLKLIITVLIFSVYFVLIFYKKEEFKLIYSKVMNILNKNYIKK